MNVLFSAAAILLALTGCIQNEPAKFNVDYCGSKYEFTNAKDQYAAGEKVTLYYNFIATDTDYSFYLDGEYTNVSYDESKGFIISFTMPEHDVELRVDSRNTMEYRGDGIEVPTE